MAWSTVQRLSEIAVTLTQDPSKADDDVIVRLFAAIAGRWSSAAQSPSKSLPASLETSSAKRRNQRL